MSEQPCACGGFFDGTLVTPAGCCDEMVWSNARQHDTVVNHMWDTGVYPCPVCLRAALAGFCERQVR